ncbi:hypothetical protein DRN98_03310 [Methanosarcinales archaeon]|nr:MAG: hypothetical protein DRN98_03310 [Methanosarcinales archaeon]
MEARFKMITGERKDLEELMEIVKTYNSLAVVGCDGCVGIYQIGGFKEAESLASLLKMGDKIKNGVVQDAEAFTVIRQCDKELIEKELGGKLDKFEAIVSTACGVGVQTMAAVFEDKVVYPALNTLFMGVQDREGAELYELCKGCGDCVLHLTGGICPMTRCAKGLLNGPCGGAVDGKCEVGDYTNDCAWVLIYEKLKSMDRLDLYTTFRLPRDRRPSMSPRKLAGGAKY